MDSRKLFDVGALFRLCLMHSKIIIGIVAIVMSAWLLYFLTATRVYTIESLIQLDSSNYSQNDPANMIYGSSYGGETIDQEMILYKSRSNMLNLIDQLGLDYEIVSEWSFLSLFGSNQEGNLEIEKLKLNSEVENKQNIEINKTGDNFYNVVIDEITIAENIKTGELFENESISIQINGTLRKTFNIEVLSKEKTIKKYQNKFDIRRADNTRNFFNSNGGLVYINLSSSNPEKAIKIVNTANEIFIKTDIEAKSAKARKAISFLDARISSVRDLLDADVDRLKDFQEENASVDVNLETESILSKLDEAQIKLSDLDIEEARLESLYTSDNIVFRNIDNERKVIEDQLRILEEEIKQLPKEQQALIDLYRNVELSQTLYSDLLGRKLNYSLIEASTLGNIRVVDGAYKNRVISPGLISGFILFFISFILGIVIALVKGIYFTPITNPAEIADADLTDLPYVGILPKREDTDVEDKKFTQSVESAIVNLRQIKPDAKTILITSATPSNGKSFSSKAFAEALANLGFKTAIIDCDFKRGTLDQAFKVNKRDKRFFEKIVEETTSLEELKVSENLYVFPRISKLKNSLHWTDSEVFKNLITTRLQNNFDYIVIDSAPFLSVADTSVLMSLSDIRLLVIRHAFSKKGEIAQALQNSDQIGLNFDGLVYNAYEKPKGYYGYYQYYGDYAYQYYAEKYLSDSYDYEDE